MKQRIFVLFTLIFLLLCSMKTSKININRDLCETIKMSRLLQKHNFSPSDNNKINLSTLKQLDNETYYKLYKCQKSSGEKNYIFGHFELSKDRIGLICYNKSRECDSDVFFFSLHIVDNCSKPKKIIVLTSEDNNNDILYIWTSTFSQNFDTLTMRFKHTSYCGIGTTLKTDTLFTEIYKIDLRSTNLDTISVKKYFKKLKQK